MGEQAWLEEALFSFIKRDDHPELAISAANLIRNVTVNGACPPHALAALAHALCFQTRSSFATVRG